MERVVNNEWCFAMEATGTAGRLIGLVFCSQEKSSRYGLVSF